ncbi:MAG: winged helix-turn-helix domain-containing protein [Anaerolineae bacterium]|nr:winged helix-turn-helix domain-containing protein [Anaerolineae bacterium]
MLTQLLRHQDALYVLERIADADCCALVGVSNSGKSSLMRAIGSRDVRRQLYGDQAHVGEAVFVYVDFNLMLETTEQGFYELILRSLLDELRRLDQDLPNGTGAQVVEQLSSVYKMLVAPPSRFQIPLSFSAGLTAACAGLPGGLALLFDEFDQPFELIDERALLNLRAIQDKYHPTLSFVTATDQRLSRIRRGRDVDEFVELFEPFTRFLGPLTEADLNQVIDSIAHQEGFTFDGEDRAFIRHHADGHLGLALSVCRALGAVTGEPVRDTAQNWLIHRQVRERLDGDLNVQAECRKLWTDLTAAEQDTLMALVGSDGEGDLPVEAAIESLREKGVIHRQASGARQGDRGEDMLLSPVFESFVRRQRLGHRRREQGVRVDVESGSVWVDGREAPQLTELEYRLLLLLYGRLNQICDKYQMVEAVWGEDYIDQVDDARIDKLLSRLRAKIEADPSNPRYLTTIRGRGYKLVGP